MKKLELKLDELRVESFETTREDPDERGTVRGHYHSDSTCLQRLCTCTYGVPADTCHFSCAGTCEGGDTCYRGCESYAGCPTDPGYPGCH